jgi:hypothetical protein
MRGRTTARPLRAAAFLLVLLAGCAPTKRIDEDIRLGVSNLRLTNAAPRQVIQLRMTDDPFYAERQDDLDTIDELGLEIQVPSNRSSRLKIGVHVSRDLETRLLETTKIADFNLAAGDVTSGTTAVRLFNETRLRDIVLEDDGFCLYVVGEADTRDVDVAQVTLVVSAKFID